MKLTIALSLAVILLVSTATARSVPRPRLCIKNFVFYDHGTEVPHSDPCTHCECNNGDILCLSAACIPPTCSDGATPVNQPGECCSYLCPPPTCLDEETGLRHLVGPIDNGGRCGICMCSPSGRIMCARPMCALPVCQPNVIPVTRPGDCCPSCPEVTCLDPDTSLHHPVGPVDKNDSCLQCECQSDGEIYCMRERCPHGACPRAVYTEGVCCPTCTFGCDDEHGNFHEVGPIEDGNPCSTCECDLFGSINCQLQLCAPVTCPGGAQPVQKPGQCCPECPEPLTCTDDDGTAHSVGKIENNDPCKWCECQGSGDITCMMASCGPLPCPAPVWSADRCCPTCPAGCNWDGKWYEPGPIPQEDKCGPTCHCDGSSGEVACSHVGCPAFRCPGDGEQYTPEGECCPVCRE